MNKVKLEELKKGDYFADQEIENKMITFTIVGDHVYVISDRNSILVVAQDLGNGHGNVMEVINISGHREYEREIDKLFSKYNREIIGTHNGIFHIDEAMAIAERIVFLEKRMPIIIRSRDEKELQKADVIIDVLERYDNIKFFDHHQFDKNHELYGLSSAGLMWKFLNEHLELEYPSIDELINEIDRQDTGIEKMPKYHLAGIISNMNQENIYGEEQDKAFERAVKLLVDVLEDLIRKDDSLKKKKNIAENAERITVQGSDIEIVKLPKDAGIFVPTHLFIGKGDVLSQYDQHEKIWKNMTIPIENGSFESKFKLTSTNKEEEVFYHKGGFFQSTKAKNGEYSFAVEGVGEITLPEVSPN